MPTTGAVASITAGAGRHPGGAAPAAAGRRRGGGPPPPPARPRAAASLTLSTPYAIRGAPSWVTAWSVGAKTASGFTLTFAAPCPAGGGTFDWLPRHPSRSGEDTTDT